MEPAPTGMDELTGSQLTRILSVGLSDGLGPSLTALGYRSARSPLRWRRGNSHQLRVQRARYSDAYVGSRFTLNFEFDAEGRFGPGVYDVRFDELLTKEMKRLCLALRNEIVAHFVPYPEEFLAQIDPRLRERARERHSAVKRIGVDFWMPFREVEHVLRWGLFLAESMEALLVRAEQMWRDDD